MTWLVCSYFERGFSMGVFSAEFIPSEAEGLELTPLYSAVINLRYRRPPTAP